MSCSIVSMTNVGGPYIISGGPRKTHPCRMSKTCTCPNGRTWELGCWGEEGEQEVLWGQDIEICYSCQSQGGCTFDYCEVKAFKYNETQQIKCNALDDCDCPNDPDTGTVNNPCE